MAGWLLSFEYSFSPINQGINLTLLLSFEPTHQPTMKKLYKNKSGRIHPSPPLLLSSEDLLFSNILPAAIITLAAALSPQDKEVLAYLISSCSSNSPKLYTSLSGKSTSKVIGSGGDHPTEFHCDCFRCYMSYWVRWDASPNRHLIHQIIEAYEDGVFSKKQLAGVLRSAKKDRKRRMHAHDLPVAKDDRGSGEPEQVEVMDSPDRHDQVVHDQERKFNEDGELGNSESGVPTTVIRKLVSFMGERIWGVWGII